ncbi:peptidoglycan-binding protein [Roseovarius nubinhibens]|uniref:peptidoglycan-binding domain-containing protein n=1 Tax=Roseovarius nubinhibens TaxID=314263 RepID=UPI001C080FDE|nr:peptidoglycan-binding domain-containing protein [Roseovarius nubinhibens]MBU2998654.1 peptidoglycan-binding protein [Roseovarius nubinhibens]
MKTGLTAGALVLALWPLGGGAQEALPLSELRREIAEIDASVSEAEAQKAKYGAGLISTLMEARIETLKLTRAVLENRVAGETGGAQRVIELPVARPDPELADKILAEILAQQKIVAAAEKEAQGASGLIGAVTQSRVETEKLSLANLRGNWLAATYGILLPITPPVAGESSAQPAPAKTATAQSAAAAPEGAEAGPDWADAAHPEIDYSKAIFSQLHREKFTIHGWWGLSQDRAAIDDSPKIFGINVSEYKEGLQLSTPKLYVSCKEGETSVVFDADDYILSDYNVNTVPVTYRIDGQDAVQDRWSKLTSSKGGGLFGAQGQRMIRQLYDAEKLFVRLTEKNGKTHDATFQLAGGQAVFDAAAAACGFSTLDLTAADYRAIQTMLNSAGYEAGTPDGVWGAGSAQEMRAWQAENGLATTGAPDRASLAAMGMN